jgi:hypothetical protein
MDIKEADKLGPRANHKAVLYADNGMVTKINI